jgi:REP element-mobilizing transposase RayT
VEFDDAFGWLITWTTYGTWLPGDPRGHASPTLQADGSYSPRRNARGVEPAAGDAQTRQKARALQRFETVRLDLDDAFEAAEPIVVAAVSRNWTITRGTVMANHVHVVVRGASGNASAISRALKVVSQAAMSRRRGTRQRWWTTGGSQRSLRGTESIAAAIAYVKNQDWQLAEIVDNRYRRIERPST